MNDQMAPAYVYLMTLGVAGGEEEIIGIFRTMEAAQRDTERTAGQPLAWVLTDEGKTALAPAPDSAESYCIVRWTVEDA